MKQINDTNVHQWERIKNDCKVIPNLHTSLNNFARDKDEMLSLS